MADNVTLNQGLGGAVVSTEEIAGVHIERTKIITGAYGVDGGDVGVSNPLPVSDDYSNIPEVLADQSGANAVLTFTFTNPVVLVLIESASGTPLSPAGLTSRIILGTAQTPTSTLGVRCTDEKVYLPSPALTTVKVYAPVGTTVNMMGWRR